MPGISNSSTCGQLNLTIVQGRRRSASDCAQSVLSVLFSGPCRQVSRSMQHYRISHPPELCSRRLTSLIRARHCLHFGAKQAYCKLVGKMVRRKAHYHARVYCLLPPRQLLLPYPLILLVTPSTGTAAATVVRYAVFLTKHPLLNPPEASITVSAEGQQLPR